MKIQIPAKTFLIGEYAVMHQAPGIVITTTPCFELSVDSNKPFNHPGIHPQSPAGLWLAAQPRTEAEFHFMDPYLGQGGLGASSAQFIAVFKAYRQLNNQAWDKNELLKAYYQFAWNGQGMRPSGYDVWAQLHEGCVYRDSDTTHSYNWPFKELDFLLLRTGHKLATHTHLQQHCHTPCIDALTHLSLEARRAFDTKQAELLLQSVNGYHRILTHDKLCTLHSQNIIEACMEQSGILAAKGCGAMGADIILLLIDTEKKDSLSQWLVTKPWPLIATSNSLFSHQKDNPCNNH